MCNLQLSKLGVKSFSSKSFGNSIMGRELSIAEVEVPGRKPLVKKAELFLNVADRNHSIAKCKSDLKTYEMRRMKLNKMTNRSHP